MVILKKPYTGSEWGICFSKLQSRTKYNYIHTLHISRARPLSFPRFRMIIICSVRIGIEYSFPTTLRWWSFFGWVNVDYSIKKQMIRINQPHIHTHIAHTYTRTHTHAHTRIRAHDDAHLHLFAIRCLNCLCISCCWICCCDRFLSCVLVLLSVGGPDMPDKAAIASAACLFAALCALARARASPCPCGGAAGTMCFWLAVANWLRCCMQYRSLPYAACLQFTTEHTRILTRRARVFWWVCVCDIYIYVCVCTCVCVFVCMYENLLLCVIHH